MVACHDVRFPHAGLRGLDHFLSNDTKTAYIALLSKRSCYILTYFFVNLVSRARK